MNAIVGTWKAIDGDLPMLVLKADGSAALQTPQGPENDLFGCWRLENQTELAIVLDIPPDPEADNEVLRAGTKEVMRFIVVHQTDKALTLEDEDGHNEIEFERVEHA